MRVCNCPVPRRRRRRAEFRRHPRQSRLMGASSHRAHPPGGWRSRHRGSRCFCHRETTGGPDNAAQLAFLEGNLFAVNSCDIDLKLTGGLAIGHKRQQFAVGRPGNVAFLAGSGAAWNRGDGPGLRGVLQVGKLNLRAPERLCRRPRRSVFRPARGLSGGNCGLLRAGRGSLRCGDRAGGEGNPGWFGRPPGTKCRRGREKAPLVGAKRGRAATNEFTNLMGSDASMEMVLIRSEFFGREFIDFSH